MSLADVVQYTPQSRVRNNNVMNNMTHHVRYKLTEFGYFFDYITDFKSTVN